MDPSLGGRFREGFPTIDYHERNVQSMAKRGDPDNYIDRQAFIRRPLACRVYMGIAGCRSRSGWRPLVNLGG